VTISYDDFARIDIRVGTITAVEPYPEARKPAYKLTVDFGRRSAPAAARRRSPGIMKSNLWWDAKWRR
jgi:tRNA-binding protein